MPATGVGPASAVTGKACGAAVVVAEWRIQATPRGGGGVSIVTQSGSYGMAVHALGRDEGLRVAKVFAAGNKADITAAELLDYPRQDPATC